MQRGTATYLTGEVDLNGLDTNVLGTSRHSGGGVQIGDIMYGGRKVKGKHLKRQSLTHKMKQTIDCEGTREDSEV